MAKRNRNKNVPDQFIVQNLIEIEKPKNNKASIIFMCVIVLLVVAGVGTVVFINRDKINWEFRLPWQDEDDPPIFGGGASGKKGNTAKQELVIPEIMAGSSGVGGLDLSAKDLTHDDKGYEFTAVLNTKEVISNITIDKVTLDGYPFTIDKEVGNLSKDSMEVKVRINQTDLDKYNMMAFSKMGIFYSFETSDESTASNRRTVLFNANINNKISYDNNIKGIIEIFRYGSNSKNTSSNVLYYYKTETDKDNTYIYFYFENVNEQNKTFTIKRLLINDELYDYEDFKFSVFRQSRDIFYLTIPKKKVREIANFNVSFFITEERGGDGLNSTYITTEYFKEV